MRKDLLQILIDEIHRTKKYADANRYNSKPDVAKNPHDIRNKYLNTLANLIDKYRKLYADVELDEIKEEIIKLKEDLNNE